nr:MAG TPA: hypothetical protein [Caudoviricetes sp.]
MRGISNDISTKLMQSRNSVLANIKKKRRIKMAGIERYIK